MIYKNSEIHNISEVIKNDDGSISWSRVPYCVYDKMETDQGKKMCLGSTGVELRFVMESDTVTLRMRTKEGRGHFHVYRGSIQGGWEDLGSDKNASMETADFVIKKSENLSLLKNITKDFNLPFAPEVVRVIFSSGSYELVDVIRDIRPPKKDEMPQKTLLTYGSSITHGSNAIDMSHSWASVLAHNLKMDCRNLGMAGSCLMEPEIVEYIAKEGENNKWDIATLELGINVLAWEKEKIIERVENTLRQIAGRNKDKMVFVISPLYCDDDYIKAGNAEKWRDLIESVVNNLKYRNVIYINGLNLLGDMSLISADQVHPNIYGVTQVAERMTNLILEQIHI